MGKIAFSEQQQKAIDASDCNLLVSAAAGSGKTAVLVNRVIRKITDVSHPVDVDRILVLTFTNAAAAQMKSKISRAILELLKERPGDSNLERQAALIHNAQITTIHSFCLYLIRNNFSQLSIDPAFKVGDTGEIKLICEEVMDELIEELFGSDQVKNFDMLADRFVSGNNVNKLKTLLLQVHGNIENNPFADDYIDSIYNDYQCGSEQELNESEWGKALFEDSRLRLREAASLSKMNLELCQSPGGHRPYIAAIESDIVMLEEGLKMDTYSGFCNWAKYAKPVQLSRAKDPDADAELRERAKKIRDTVKAIIGKIREKYMLDADILLQHMQQNNLVYQAMLDVVRLYRERLWTEKEKRRVIEFSDMEHLALELLYKKTENGRVPSNVALSYRDMYDEIMIDEYQDSNEIQEYVLAAISGEQEGRFNRFMVGDVKQSIYSFRNACPDLFMEKYNNYCYETGECRKIDLSGNYRSRSEVIDSTNYIFEKIMDQDFGGIKYDEHARLERKAEYPQADDNRAEIMLMCGKAQNDEAKAMEAAMVAAKIKELVADHQVRDGDNDGLRKCEYRDIVILLRTNSGWDDIFKQVLEQNGIPTYIESKSGYFDTTEIRTVMNMLSVLDNPLNDIALYGTMTDIFGGFDENEVALLKMQHKGYLYDAVKAAAANNELDEGIREKCSKFIDFIEKYREKVVYTPIHLLLMEILDEFSYMIYVDGQAYGEQRRANVAMLLEKARSYEEGSFKGLYHFIRYISKLKSYSVEYGEASTLDEKANVVRITSIHKSKGLEYPVCFVCGINKEYNNSDSKAAVAYYKGIGFGFDYVDTKLGAKIADLRHKFITDNITGSMRMEELRILYVAMTRAKEKLILTGSVANIDGEMEKNALQLYIANQMGGNVLPHYIRSGFTSYYDCISACVDLQAGNRFFDVSMYTFEELEADAITHGVNRARKRLELEQLAGDADEAAHDTDELVRRISYQYPHALDNLYNKVSVSDLKHDAIEKMLEQDEEKPQTIFETDVKNEYIPSFRRNEADEPGGTQTGSAYHRVMELWHFEDDDWVGQEVDADKCIHTLIEDGLLDEEDARLVKKPRVMTFLSSELAMRMHDAAKAGNLYVEQPFVLGIGADRMDESFPDTETVLIQGIIDAFFIEDGKAILMDYKTDRVETKEELIDRYRTQLEYYEEAIERITGIKVAQKLIYSFIFGETIEL